MMARKAIPAFTGSLRFGLRRARCSIALPSFKGKGVRADVTPASAHIPARTPFHMGFRVGGAKKEPVFSIDNINDCLSRISLTIRSPAAMNVASWGLSHLKIRLGAPIAESQGGIRDERETMQGRGVSSHMDVRNSS